MPRFRPLPASALLLAFAAGPAAAQAAADGVTVYRCTDAAGGVTLRDTPCEGAVRQEVRTMVRPQDPPPPPAPPPVRATRPAPPGEPLPARVAVVRAPRPMYECVTPDGERYTSDDGDGNPRIVPLWTMGIPYGPPGHRPRPGDGARGGVRPPATGLSTAPVNNISIPSERNLPPRPRTRVPTRPYPPYPGHGHVYGGGTWVRDTCTPLPQSEACARLRDRREVLRGRFFNAQESERERLRREERTLNARLAEDCGIR